MSTFSRTKPAFAGRASNKRPNQLSTAAALGLHAGTGAFAGDGKCDVLVGMRSGPASRANYKNNLPGIATVVGASEVIDAAFLGGLYLAA
jgi:hypothetical protein